MPRYRSRRSFRSRKRYGTRKRRYGRSRRRFGYRRAFARQVLRVMKPELKYAEVQVVAHEMADDAAFFFGIMTGNSVISKGTDSDQRIGDRIDVRNIHFKWALRANDNATDDVQLRCFMAVVQWRGDIGNDPPTTTGDLLLSTNEPLSPWKPEAHGKFRVLWRRTFSYTTTAGEINSAPGGSVYVRPRGLTTFDGTSNVRNHIGLMAFANASVASQNAPILNVSGLVRFRDV